MRSAIIFSCFSVLLLASCAKTRIKDHAEWGNYFTENGIKNGCFILRDNNHEAIHYYNKDRCLQRFLPASTFKIFNSLVALETAVAPDDKLVIKWDGIARRPEWDKDMDMREAFKVSNVAYYQEIARRIGMPRMRHFLDTAKYGNMRNGDSIDKFWLNDTLQISPDEQVGFVKRLYFNELPFSERSQRIVRDLMLREDSTHYKLYYKTGTGMVGNKTVYWVVGFCERIVSVNEAKESMNKTNDRAYPYFFAENFEMPTSDTSKNWFETRIDIMHKVLRDYGAIPSPQNVNNTATH